MKKFIFCLLYFLCINSAYARMGWLGGWPYPLAGKTYVDMHEFNAQPTDISFAPYTRMVAYDEVITNNVSNNEAIPLQNDTLLSVEPVSEPSQAQTNTNSNVVVNETGKIIPNEQNNLIDINNMMGM